MKKLFTLFVLAALCFINAMATDTWTVVGSSAIMNGSVDWNPEETLNDMITEDSIHYTLTIEDKTLEAGKSYEFKFVKNHSWSNGSIGNEYDGNILLSVNKTAVYKITYTLTFNKEETGYDVYWTWHATKTGEVEGELTHTYSIAGSSEELFGAVWSETNTATEMTKGADSTYSWTNDNADLTAGTILYKVVEDHSWGICYGDENGGNAQLEIPADGNYSVTITFNPDTKEVSATATQKTAISAVNAVLVQFLHTPFGGRE